MIKFNEIFNIKSTEMRIAETTLVKINSLKSKMRAMSDEELSAQTEKFIDLLEKGTKSEDIRAEAFATAREATWRILKKEPFDVQMLGGVILDLGSVAEMKTGEGKTIASIAPVYLNALAKNGVIVSTVNEYLAERDADELRPVYEFLGLTVCVNKPQLNPEAKKQAYACDITYSIHSELGFDYLRDNMVQAMDQKVQRGLNYILLDEVDSILIDEAKTPLIISGGSQHDSHLYEQADMFAHSIRESDYEIDHESKSIKLTNTGIDKANRFFSLTNLYDIKNSEIVHRIQNALRAHKIMSIDVEYIVLDNKIELIDSFTGRVMEGRSYSEGLQQAIQAKEKIEIEAETKTLATITYQNFFRLFKKLSGMTGTGKTEEQEFIDIYNMRVNVIPTNLPIVRKDDTDVFYYNTEFKNQGIVKEVKKVHKTGQPLLIGTQQIEQSEDLHRLFIKAGIRHTVLNAKQNKNEADIISRAGEVGSVTIATNMAGRGTDIKPSKEALELGGLYVLGTDKSEARRIGNQLRGRSGRQGDVGYSRFFLSLDDQLILRFAMQDKWKSIFKDAGSEPIKGNELIKAMNQAQKKIEGFNYDSRKTVLNYDDVIRQQRDLIYAQRDLILVATDLLDTIETMIDAVAKHIVKMPIFALKNGSLNYPEITKYLNSQFLNLVEFKFDEKLSHIHPDDLALYIADNLYNEYAKLRVNIAKNYGEHYVVADERSKLITTLDQLWQEHINTMDKLRSNTNLVQYAQKNPYQIYTEEGTKKFSSLTINIALFAVEQLFNNRNAILQESQISELESFFSGADFDAAKLKNLLVDDVAQLTDEQQKIYQNFSAENRQMVKDKIREILVQITQLNIEKANGKEAPK